MNKTGLLSALANLCNLPKEGIKFGDAAAIQPSDSDLITAEQNLCKWIKESSGKILKDVIPEKFWTEHDLSKPSKVSQLCPDKVNDSVVVLLVVLWSWCSPKCYREITVCLKYGAKNWQTDDKFKPIDWLRTYVKSIWLCVVYSSREIRSEARKKSALEFAKRTVLIDAYGLSQAVSNSSEWFGFLTSKQVPILIFNIFANRYVSERKLKAKFMGSVRNLSVFSDDDREVVTYWSIATWFKRSVILPSLVEMMTLVPMVELVKEITTLRCTNNERTQHMRMATYRKVLEEATRKLGLDSSGKENPVDGTLAVFVELAQQMIEKKTKHVIIDNEKLVYNEKLVLKILCPVLVDAAINRKRGIVLLKEMMTKKPPLFPDNFVKAVTNNVTCHFPSSTEGVSLTGSSETNPKSQNTKVMERTPTREKPKEGKSIEEKGNPTVEKLPNGVNREGTATTVQVIKSGKTMKKRKIMISQDTRKSIRTNDGKNERISEEVGVGEEEKKVTQTQLDNKTEGDELGKSKTPLFELGNLPKGSSPYKTPLIGFGSRPKKTTQRRTTSPNVLSSDTSKERDHKWGEEQTLDTMERIRHILDYFSEDGEMDTYRERWERCKKISETHKQSFETSKMKGRNIVQDLFVVLLALISTHKMPKEPNQPEKRTFHEIEKSMKSFDWKNEDMGQILSHLIVSFKLLHNDTYVQECCRKHYVKYK